jgi:hypothetical protein
VDDAGEGGGLLGFAVNEEDIGGRLSEHCEPFDEVILVGMAEKPSRLCIFALTPHFFAHYLDPLDAFDQPASKTAFGLVADEDDAGFRAPEVCLR